MLTDEYDTLQKSFEELSMKK